MMAKNIIINGEKVGLGQTAQVRLEVSRLPTRTPIDIPVIISRGTGPGPTLLLLAGMHGDEINGVEIIRRLIRDKSTKPENGTVIAIPVLNIYGFLQFSRQVPDGKDVNRSFPGSKNGSLASRVAYECMHRIIPLIDYGIDFHTGSKNLFNYPQIRCKLDNDINSELAQAFGAPLILNAPFRDSSLRKEAFKKGKSIIVYEGGESMRFDEEVIEEGVRGAIRVMHHLGMISKSDRSTIIPTVINSSGWLRSRHAGLFHAKVKVGEVVRKNHMIGTITDPYGDFRQVIKSPHEAIVVGLNHMPVVNQGDALVHLGRE